MALLNEVKKDGEALSLVDGSEWSVNPGDIPTCCTWMPAGNIKIEKINNGDPYNYKLINLDEGTAVRAMKLS